MIYIYNKNYLIKKTIIQKININNKEYYLIKITE